MKLFRTREGVIVERHATARRVRTNWDDIFLQPDVTAYLEQLFDSSDSSPITGDFAGSLQAPIEAQEVWAAGVTYFRSRTARMEESRTSGGGDFYDRVYVAERPELFFKSTSHRVAGPNQHVRIRKDSMWNVPEPELALAISKSGKVFGYTIGNDMSSRDIEGENPLYLPQAKVYDKSCALGPCIFVSDAPLESSTEINLRIVRDERSVFAGTTTLAQIKRQFSSLVEYLYRDNSFPFGCFLLTGTGIVPPDDFTLESGDDIHITIRPVGTLTNTVE